MGLAIDPVDKSILSGVVPSHSAPIECEVPSQEMTQIVKRVTCQNWFFRYHLHAARAQTRSVSLQG